MADFDTPSGDMGGGGNSSGAPPALADSGSFADSATATPGSGGDGISDTKGPVPYERFAEVNQRLGNLRWAESYQQDQVQQAAQLMRWLEADPEGAYGYIGNLLKQQGYLKPPPEQRQGTRPQPDVVNPSTGQKFYSAEAAEQLLQWELGERLSPIEERLQAADTDRAQHRANIDAQATLAEADTWPYFKEHQAPILQAMEADKRLSIEGAYRKVVLPKIRTLERQAIVSEMGQKGRATTADPNGRGATNMPLSKLSMQELFKREVAKRGGKL